MSKPDLSVCMAVYDDLDGLYFTVQAINLFHPEVKDIIEILVLDNNPDSEHGVAVGDFLKNIKNARYFPYGEWQSTAVRDVLFDEAESDYVLCVDSHVLIEPGAISRLIDYYNQNVHSGDLLQGPMLYEDLYGIPPATHFDHVWENKMLGVWGADKRGFNRDYPPFEIPMQGLGLFSCRKDAWLGFNRLFRGFGGEEWYIHEKFRRAGKKTLCLPFLRWTHRFRRPDGANYNLHLDDRVYNYFVGHLELDTDVAPICEHFKEMGAERLDQLYELAKKDLLLAPLRLRNSAPEIPIVTCLMVVNNVSQMHLNEAVESFHRQHYQARELVIFNDGPNILECNHPLVRIINYPSGLSSLNECVKTALPACNGDIICLWDGHGIELPWRISVDVEMIENAEFWQPANFWRGEVDGMALRLSNYDEFIIPNCVFRRSWLAENSLDDAMPIEHLELTRVSTITRDAQHAGHSDPMEIKTGWRLGYDILASDAAVRVLNERERDKPLPTFLAVCDVVPWAEAAIENLNRIGGIEIILVDNASTNPKMIKFLNDSEYEVIKLEKRVDQSEIWSTWVQGSINGLFAAVHSFFDLSDLPANTPSVLCGVLDTIGVSRCGVSVRLFDIPEHNPCRADITEEEDKHWRKQDGDYYDTDAGFAFIVGRSDRLSEKFDHWYAPQRRLSPPYTVKYLPWYLNLEDRKSVPEDVLYYLEHSAGDLFGQYVGASDGVS